MYVYKIANTRHWVVGFYRPDGTWEEESAWSSANQAAERVHWLNGGTAKSSASEGTYPSETAGVMQL